ncbi:MAG: hypothetical protein AAF329_24965, partial [Cyanobacteria bacterium P01_A01_bin.17]
ADAEVRQRYSERSIEVFGEQNLYCEVNAFLEVIERIKANGSPSTQGTTSQSTSVDRVPVKTS